MLLTVLASCNDTNENPPAPPTPPQPTEDAIVLDQLQAFYMGAADGKTADLKLAFFNGAYGADVEGFDYEVLMIEAINDMPEPFEPFIIEPGSYKYTAEYSGVSGQFVGGSIADDTKSGTYFKEVKDGVETTYIVTGGSVRFVKGASYVMVATLDGYILDKDKTPFEGKEFYYSGPIAFENRDIPQGAIVLNKFHSEYLGDVLGTGTAFIATSFYNGEIDFTTGPVGAYEIFVMEAFNTLPYDPSTFELATGEYTIDSNYTGAPLKFIEGDPTGGSYKGTFYRKVDALGNDTGYCFTGGTINVTAYGETYKVVANLDGYIFNPDDENDMSNTIEDVAFYYYGKAGFEIEVAPANELNDGQAIYWGDSESTGTDKIVLNLYQMDTGDPNVRMRQFGLTLYAEKASYPDPNILVEEYQIPAGRYEMKNDKSAMSVLSGTFTAEYGTSGSMYAEIGYEAGPPTKLLVITDGYVEISYPNGKFHVELSFGNGKDFGGNESEIGDWMFDGFIPVTDKRTIEYEALTPTFTKARLQYHETIDGVGIAYLIMSSDEFTEGGARYDMVMEVRTHDQSASSVGNLMLTPVDYVPDTAGTTERFTFKIGSYDATNKNLYRSWYQQIYTDEQTITAPVVLNGGKISCINNGSEGSIIAIALEGQNMRTNRPVKINTTWKGVIEMIKE